MLLAIGIGVGIAYGLRNKNKTGIDICHDNMADEGLTGDELNDEGTSSYIHINSSFASYRYAAVSSDAGVCSSIGTDILARQHGSAIDAAIATLLCMGVVNAHSTGIGGGFFMVAYDSKSVTTLDAREVAPSASNPSMFRGDTTLSRIGGLSVAIPGQIAGYWAAHQRFGRLPWATLFQPTIKLCNEGIPVTLGLSRAIQYLHKAMMDSQEWRDKFTDSLTGEPLRQGGLYYCKKLASTLRVIAEEGESAFYTRSLSQDILQDLQEHGSIITQADLEGYRPEWREALTLDLDNDLTIYTLPAPSGGPIVAYILNILKGYNFTSEDMNTVESKTLTYHRIIESMKFAHAKKESLGDPKYVDVSELLRNMTSREEGRYINRKIDDKRTYDLSYYGPAFADVIDTGATHMSLMDADGNAVSITSSINYNFGSRIVGSRTGIIFNDLMDDFSFALDTTPVNANVVEPGKRPLSSMCPAIILDKNSDVKLVVGASGGSLITTAIVQVILRAIYFGEGLDVAVNAERLHHQLLPPHAYLEKGMFPKEIISGLERKGHNVTYKSPYFGPAVQAVLHDEYGVLHAIADGRKVGLVDGY